MIYTSFIYKKNGLSFLGLFIISLLLALLLFLLTNNNSLAQELDDCNTNANYLDFDQNGSPDAVEVRTHFSPAEEDLITIVDGNNEMNWESCWQNSVDFEYDSWLYDAGADGKTNLLIVFQKQADSIIADLYDDQNGNGHVDYKIEPGKVQSIESQFWSVRVVAADTWWVNDSKVNYNLKIYTDGKIEGAFGANQLIDELTHDGKIDFYIQTHDVDHDGKAEYELRFFPQLPHLRHLAGFDTHIMVNWADNELLPDQNMLWPFVGAHEDKSSNVVRIKGDRTLPPILLDWQNSKIVAIHEIVASRANENNCFFYSSVRPVLEEINDLNFEAPFCFYDLAKDKDRVPELIIRHQYWLANDRMFLSGQFPYPMAQIRYSWDQDNNETLDYAIGLAGRNAIETLVSILDFEVHTVPYNDFPNWATENKWDTAIFVAAERNYTSSEGIYEVDLPLELLSDYLTGLTSVMSLQSLQEYKESLLSPSLIGLRLERSLEFDNQPYLYFSPIDKALHLVGLQDGLWEIDAQATIEYQNLNADPYIDQWSYFENGESKKQLFHAGDWVIYASEEQVKVAQAKAPKALFETLPPRTHQEWLELQEKLDSQEKEFAPGDFERIVDQFKAQVVHNATLRGFRFTDDGFRFVMELSKDFRVAKGKDWLGIKELSAGSYLVSYQNNRFLSEPLTPALPALVAGSLQLDQEPIALQPLQIRAVLENKGLSDIPALPVYLHAARSDGQAEIVSESEIPLLGEEISQVSFTWAPPTEGGWKLWLTLGEADHASTTEEMKMEVAAAQGPSLYWSLQRVGTRGGIVAFVSLAVMLAVIAVSTIALMLPSLLESESK